MNIVTTARPSIARSWVAPGVCQRCGPWRDQSDAGQTQRRPTRRLRALGGTSTSDQ
jgi:hypothetical protein